MLLFLHGFLGQKEDWDPLLSYLPSSLPIHTLNLPGHGEAPTANDIALAIKAQVPSAKFLIGYSAGGRVALELKHRFPHNYGRVIAISAHPGILTPQQRSARLLSDEQWISLLQTTPIDHFLQKWYSQDLFKTLKFHPHFPELLARRTSHNPLALAHFLTHFSLAKKEPSEISPSTIWIHGKQDLKYEALYCTLLTFEKIFSLEKAGHAAHIENPEGCAKIILGAIHDHY